MKTAIVVGSGAGGAMAAQELSRTHQVTIIEAGGPFRPFGMSLEAMGAFRRTRLLRDPRMIQAFFPAMRVIPTRPDGMPVVRGITTGGSTVLSTGSVLRADRELAELGIDLRREYGELEQELPILRDASVRPGSAAARLYDAFTAARLDPQPVAKVGDHRRCRRCGRCVFGCPYDVKWDARAVLRRAVANGAMLRTGERVERVLLSHGRAEGVLLRRGPGRRREHADLVVLAAGGLGTPAILRRTGIAVADRLFVDPVITVSGHVAGSDLHRDLPMPFFSEHDGYILSPYFDFLSHLFGGGRRPMDRTLSIMIKLADTGQGTVRPMRAGATIVRKPFTQRDEERVRDAVARCTDLLVRAGAPKASISVGMRNAGHPGGCVPYPAAGLPDGLLVADASLLPRSLGKPPMLTIMAFSKRVVQSVQAALEARETGSRG